MDEAFHTATQALPPALRDKLQALPSALTARATEIRLREGMPVALTADGRAQSPPPLDSLRPDAALLEETFLRLCGNSVYTHQNDINSGFVTLPGGHRVGVCGTAVVEAGRIVNLRRITSLNLRVARLHREAARETMRLVCPSGALPGNLLLFGPPLSGKTTLLRALALELSDAGYKVVVIDERMEMDLLRGERERARNIDLFSGYPRRQGIEQALRCFSPQVLLFDEVGNPEDCQSLLSAVNTGVTVVTTAHARDFAALRRRALLRELVEGGLFDVYVELGCGRDVGRVRRVWKQGGEKDEAGGPGTAAARSDLAGTVQNRPPARTGDAAAAAAGFRQQRGAGDWLYGPAD